MSQPRTLKIVALLASIGALAPLLHWYLRVRIERVEAAWVVPNGSEFSVAFVERKSADDDYLVLRTMGAGAAQRTELGSTRDRVAARFVGPVDDKHLWVHTNTRGLELLDLLTHERVGAIADVRPADGRWVDAEGRALVVDPKNRRILVGTDLAKQAPGPDPDGRDGRCVSSARAARELLNADTRGCLDADAIVQHSETKERQDWRVSRVAPDGGVVWSLAASDLGASAQAWFGHALGHGDALWMTLVEPGSWRTSVQLLRLDASTGALQDRSTP